MQKPDIHNHFQLRRTMGLWDDFLSYTSGQLWTTTKDTTPTVAAGDAQGGILTLTGDTTGNDEAYAALTNQVFKYTDKMPIIGEAAVQFAEANTNQAAMMFGFMSAVGANAIVDTTGEPKASFSGAVIYKTPGSTVWKTCSSIGTTQTKNTSDTTAGGSAFQRLLIEIMPVSATLAEVTYYVDGIQLKSSGGRPGQTKIKDQVTYTGAAAMGLFVGMKQIATGVAEVLKVDYIAAEHLTRLYLGF